MAVTPDSSGVSAHQASLASGTPFTFTQTATAGAYAIVAIFGASSSAATPTDTATVTFGGQTMTSEVSVLCDNNSSNGYIWVWVLPSVAVGGSNTVSVEFSSGNAFTGWAASFTYLDVGSIGTPVTEFGSTLSETFPVPSATGNMVWGAWCWPTTSSTLSQASLTSRETESGARGLNRFLAGDAAGASSVPLNGSFSSATEWAAVGINLIAQSAATANLSAVGALTAAASPTVKTALSGHGLLTVTASASLSPHLSAHGVLSATAHPAGTLASASLSARGVLSAIAHAKVTGHLSAHGGLTGVLKPLVTAHLSAHGGLTSSIKARVTAFLSSAGLLSGSAGLPKVAVFLVDGTHTLVDWLSGGEGQFPDNPVIPTTLPPLIDSSLCDVQQISYPASVFPMTVSMNQGLATLNAAIRACGTKFILGGYSQGAGVISLCLNELRSGSMTAFLPQFLGAVTFGNISRQAGKVAPVQTDPGGEGCWSTNILTDTPSNWWDFALELDAATTVPFDTAFGVDLQIAFNLVVGSFIGGNLIEFFLLNMQSGWMIDAEAVGDLVMFGAVLIGLIPNPPGLVSLGPHGQYYTNNPPGTVPVIVDGVIQNTCAQYAADYINQLATPT